MSWKPLKPNEKNSEGKYHSKGYNISTGLKHCKFSAPLTFEYLQDHQFNNFHVFKRKWKKSQLSVLRSIVFTRLNKI